MSVLWLDDLRNPKDYGVVGAFWTKSYSLFKKDLCSKTKNVKEIHLDHDLGNDSDGTGYNAILLIEEMLYGNMLTKLETIYIHTSNPSAASKMMAVKDLWKNRFGVNVLRNNY